MRHFRIIPFLVMAALALPAMAQRKVTPVNPDDKSSSPRLYYYDKHGNPLKEPVEFLVETDTVARPSSGPKYPLLHNISFGVNFFDAVMLLAGQKHASFDAYARLSLHNWFFPVVEAGMGFAKDTPETGNFTYTGKPSFYVKAGLDYNFLYKSNPAYQVFLGLRAAYSSLRYSMTDITINSGYWNQTERFSMPDATAHAFYGEVLAGIQVKIAGNFSLGWTGRYHFKFKVKSPSDSNPWFIPGYGTKAPVSFTFSAIWTIPLSRPAPPPEAETETTE